MPWVRLDDGFTDHPKIAAAGPLAGWLYVCGLTYAARFLTDGFIPQAQVRRLADVEAPVLLAERLVALALWEVVDGGYCIHDYLAYQPSAEQVQGERAAARQRMAQQRAGEVRGNNGRSADEVQLPRTHPGYEVPGPDPDPDPRPAGVRSPPARGRARRAPKDYAHTSKGGVIYTSLEQLEGREP